MLCVQAQQHQKSHESGLLLSLPETHGSCPALREAQVLSTWRSPATPSSGLQNRAAPGPGARGHTGLAARLSRRGSGVRERVPEPHRLLRSAGRSGDTAPCPLWLRGPYSCLLTKRSQRHYRRPPTGRRTLSAESFLPARAGWTGELRTRSCSLGTGDAPTYRPV